MTQGEIGTRCAYLFEACFDLLESIRAEFAAAVPSPSPQERRMLDKAVTRELGLLFRYWATSHIWRQCESNETDARHLNLAVLRLFTDQLKLPKDGSGLRYAELPPTDEEGELGRRISQATGIASAPLLRIVHGSIESWREVLTRHTAEAVELPVGDLAARTRAKIQGRRSERTDDAGSASERPQEP